MTDQPGIRVRSICRMDSIDQHAGVHDEAQAGRSPVGRASTPIAAPDLDTYVNLLRQATAHLDELAILLEADANSVTKVLAVMATQAGGIERLARQAALASEARAK